VGASVYFASTLLATDIPSAGDRIAVLSFTRNGTTTTIVKVRECVNTFKVKAGQTGYRARSQALGAKVDRATMMTLALLLGRRGASAGARGGRRLAGSSSG